MSDERRIMLADQPERGSFTDLATQTLAQDIDRNWVARGMDGTGTVKPWKTTQIPGVTPDDP